MFNNINNNDLLYGDLQSDKQNNIIRLNLLKTNSATNPYKSNPYVDKTEISGDAIRLFEKDCDIKKFNNIALSDLDNNSHLDRMKELFADGVIDVFEDDVMAELVTNAKLWDDLER
ncbi:MAG: hypothetical protein MJ237_01395 [bacterium]|nr:hypothetical protein [bacterium]